MSSEQLRLRVFDSPKHQDRHTVVYDTGDPNWLPFIAMNSNPLDKETGLMKRGEVAREWLEHARNSEILFENLPDACQRVVLGDIQTPAPLQ